VTYKPFILLFLKY